MHRGAVNIVFIEKPDGGDIRGQVALQLGQHGLQHLVEAGVGRKQHSHFAQAVAGLTPPLFGAI